ncbi:MAG: ABC transporter permease [Planctomycetaceae bacterium]|nr:ABC transporter permease [Planctomycetaceae bacterium]
MPNQNMMQTTFPKKLTEILSTLGPLLALAFVFFGFALLAPMGYIDGNFVSLNNIVTILKQAVQVATVALGMTMIIASGGIDLSVGSLTALVSVTVALILNQEPFPGIVFCALAGGILVGVIAGAVHGVIVTQLKIVPFIVTLGTMLIFRGLAKGWAGSKPISIVEDFHLSDIMLITRYNKIESDFFKPSFLAWIVMIPLAVWILIVLSVVTALILHYTKFGRYVFAIGSNEQTAILCGVPVNWTKIKIYMIAGFFVGIAGIFSFAEMKSGDPTSSVGLELRVIAAVVVGGASLSGGKGSILGTLCGALIIKTIDSACTMMSLSNWVQDIVTGAIIVIAVVVDRMRTALSSSKV